MKDELRKRRHTLLFAPAFAVAPASEQAGAGALSSLALEGILGERFRFDMVLFQFYDLGWMVYLDLFQFYGLQKPTNYTLF